MDCLALGIRLGAEAIRSPNHPRPLQCLAVRKDDAEVSGAHGNPGRIDYAILRVHVPRVLVWE